MIFIRVLCNLTLFTCPWLRAKEDWIRSGHRVDVKHMPVKIVQERQGKGHLSSALQ